jgi:hypothetical protein
MSELIKTSLYLEKEDKQFIDNNCISLTKFVRSSIHKLKDSIGSDSNPQPIEDPHHCIGESNG